MTVTDQIKILNRKIKQNEVQYDLGRKAAKTSALSSNNLDKYEYLTGEDLDLKPSTAEQAKFEYSPLGKTFNKDSDEDYDKKEGLLKRLKNIESKNEEQLKATEDQKEIQTKIKPSLLKSIYSQEVKDGRINNNDTKKIFKTLEDMERCEINYCKLLYKSGDNKHFDFARFGPLSGFYLKLISGDIIINDAKLIIKEFKNEINRLKNKKTKKKSYKKLKKMS